ncbi:hypothetical protein FQN54_007316 [Arachnomyces sp. PD_36]|nr:hypothetical protein FQN54_007316 [Arachnomyces sp. PD_36]
MLDGTQAGGSGEGPRSSVDDGNQDDGPDLYGACRNDGFAVAESSGALVLRIGFTLLSVDPLPPVSKRLNMTRTDGDGRFSFLVVTKTAVDGAGPVLSPKAPGSLCNEGIGFHYIFQFQVTMNLLLGTE